MENQCRCKLSWDAQNARTENSFHFWSDDIFDGSVIWCVVVELWMGIQKEKCETNGWASASATDRVCRQDERISDMFHSIKTKWMHCVVDPPWNICRYLPTINIHEPLQLCRTWTPLWWMSLYFTLREVLNAITSYAHLGEFEPNRYSDNVK